MLQGQDAVTDLEMKRMLNRVTGIGARQGTIFAVDPGEIGVGGVEPHGEPKPIMTMPESRLSE